MRRIPFIPQVELSDCGAACLAMVLRAFGRYVPQQSLRQRMGISVAGATAYDLAMVARQEGLRACPVRVAAGDITALASPAILHWKTNHFVVLERANRRVVQVLDPRRGRTKVWRAELDELFSGLALELSPEATFQPVAVPWRRILTATTRGVQLGGPLGRFGAAVLALALSWWLLPASWFLFRVCNSGGSRATWAWVIVAAALVSTPLLRAVLVTVRDRQLLALRQALRRNLGQAVIDSLRRMPLSFFQRRDTHELAIAAADLGRSWEVTLRVLLAAAEAATVLVQIVGGLLVSRLGGLVLLATALWQVFSVWACGETAEDSPRGPRPSFPRAAVAGLATAGDLCLLAAAGLFAARLLIRGALPAVSVAALALGMLVVVSTIGDLVPAVRSVPRLWWRLVALWDLVALAEPQTSPAPDAGPTPWLQSVKWQKRPAPESGATEAWGGSEGASDDVAVVTADPFLPAVRIGRLLSRRGRAIAPWERFPWLAARIAKLAARLPAGLFTTLGVDGAPLTTVERQLLAVAVALDRPAILFERGQRTADDERGPLFDSLVAGGVAVGELDLPNDGPSIMHEGASVG